MSVQQASSMCALKVTHIQNCCWVSSFFSLLNTDEVGCSHLLMEHPRRTLKLLFAIARGCWVLNPGWLLGSLARRRWLPEELFENSTFVGCRMSRINHQQQAPTLFRGLHIFIVGCSAIPVAKLEELLYLTGANIVQRAEDAAVIIADNAESLTAFRQTQNQKQEEKENGLKRQRGAIECELKQVNEKAKRSESVSLTSSSQMLVRSSSSLPSLTAVPALVRPSWVYDCLTHFMIMPTDAYVILLHDPVANTINYSPEL